MSATTMETATRTETGEPRPEREPGHAGLPVSDAAISVHTFSAAASSCIVQAHAPQFKQCYQWLNLRQKIGSIIPVAAPCHSGLRKHRGAPTIATRFHGLLSASGRGEFSGRLMSLKRVRAYAG